MKKQEVIERKERVKEMRDSGMKIPQIAQELNVSRQMIYSILKTKEKKLPSARKCVYKGLQEWMLENKITTIDLCKRVFGEASQRNYYRISSFLEGKITRFHNDIINSLIDITGLSFEELFKN